MGLTSIYHHLSITVYVSMFTLQSLPHWPHWSAVKHLSGSVVWSAARGDLEAISFNVALWISADGRATEGCFWCKEITLKYDTSSMRSIDQKVAECVNELQWIVIFASCRQDAKAMKVSLDIGTPQFILKTSMHHEIVCVLWKQTWHIARKDSLESTRIARN